MYCHSCGAPMTLFRERGYFYCEYCGSYHFPNPTPDGLRLLGEAPDRLKCPVCRTTLHLATLDDRVHGHHCTTCRGLLLDRFAFRDALYARRAAATEPPAPPIPLDRSELQRRVQCPRCGHRMDTHPYLGPGNIVIDTCNTCNLIWLDGSELQRAVNAPGADRGAARPQPHTSEADLIRALHEQQRKRQEDKPGFDLTLSGLLDALF